MKLRKTNRSKTETELLMELYQSLNDDSVFLHIENDVNGKLIKVESQHADIINFAKSKGLTEE